jgi:hypothetical protein
VIRFRQAQGLGSGAAQLISRFLIGARFQKHLFNEPSKQVNCVLNRQDLGKGFERGFLNPLFRLRSGSQDCSQVRSHLSGNRLPAAPFRAKFGDP